MVGGVVVVVGSGGEEEAAAIPMALGFCGFEIAAAAR
jgi:hypothetical protein